MNEDWSFYNKWLRSQAHLPPKRRNTLIISMPVQSALELALVKIQRFVKYMNTGKAGTEVRVKKVAGGIELFVEDSKEMYTLNRQEESTP